MTSWAILEPNNTISSFLSILPEDVVIIKVFIWKISSTILKSLPALQSFFYPWVLGPPAYSPCAFSSLECFEPPLLSSLPFDSAVFPRLVWGLKAAGINTAVCVYFFACVLPSHEMSDQLWAFDNYAETGQQREQINSKYWGLTVTGSQWRDLVSQWTHVLHLMVTVGWTFF